MRPTLEEERRALLEQFEASRAVYRRLLNTRTAPQDTSKPGSGFPRSHTMRWIVSHRWQLALGVAALILIRPYRQLHNRAVIQNSRILPRISPVKALAAGGARLLKNRNSLHLAGRMAGLLLRWMQQRRAKRVLAK